MRQRDLGRQCNFILRTSGGCRGLNHSLVLAKGNFLDDSSTTPDVLSITSLP